MAIIISRNGKNAQRLERSVIEREDYLQRYIYDNPDALPLHELKDDVRLCILAREFSTGSGPIDVLGIDGDGDVYIIETKLYKNPDKRLVIAQVLDYGASMWSTYSDAGRFIEKLEQVVSARDGAGLGAKLMDFFGIMSEELGPLLEQVHENVREGRFHFVVLMDRIPDRLKDLISYVNANSRFDVLGVELDFYQHEGLEIIIPNLYGAETRKDLSAGRSNVRRHWDETTFFEDAEVRVGCIGLGPLRELYEWSATHANEIAWGTGRTAGSFNAKFDNVATRSLYTVYSSGDLAFNFVHLQNSAAAKHVVEALAISFRQSGAIEMPSDYATREVHFPYERWAPTVGRIVDALKNVLVSDSD